MLKKGPLQAVLWLVMIGVNLGFAANVVSINAAFIFAITNVFFLALVFYTNYFFLFPRFFNWQNNRRFFIITFLFILFVELLQLSIEMNFFVKFAPHPPEHINEVGRHIFLFFKGFFWLWLVDLTGIVFLMQEQIKEQTVHAQKLKEEKLQTELKLLKAQINPHFIFNALNNTYSLAYIKSDSAPESILKLSQMLRYVFEECSRDKVLLNSEIEYIENYVSFQQMKSPEKQNIVFESDKVDGHAQISPMLFIPFIENSFKYSKVEEAENAFVYIKLESSQNTVLFEIRNSIPADTVIKPGAGMGIENVKQRLQIIYPDNYSLDIRQEDQEYCVKLEITLI